jgi:hypothetical protein
MVLDHRLRAQDPLRAARADDGKITALLGEAPVDLDRASALVAG